MSLKHHDARNSYSRHLLICNKISGTEKSAKRASYFRPLTQQAEIKKKY